MRARPLQKRLISSLTHLIPHAPISSEKELKRVRAALKSVEIPQDDYLKVLNLILLLLKKNPEIMENPNDKPLKELCIDCINQVKLPLILNSRKSFNR